ncbi:MAG: hypothetical protein GX754_01925 [Clostridiaceae bacterium]|nr:hypothetical protein [Clostridiaceae bacterium]
MRQVLKKNNGITLIELTVTMAIIFIIIAVLIPLYTMARRALASQLDEAGWRMDVRQASSLLSNDVRYSKRVTVDPGNTSSIEVYDKDSKTILYFMKNEPGKENCLVRYVRGDDTTIEFKGIKGAQFGVEINRLISARFFFDDEDGENKKYYDFKIARLSHKVYKKDFYSTLRDTATFVYGSTVNFTQSMVSSPDGTVMVYSDVYTTQVGLCSEMNVKYIYIDGNVNLNTGSFGMGLDDNTGEIHIGGDLYLGIGTRHIYGTVYVGGDLHLKDAVIHGTMYIKGNVTLDWTPDIRGIIYYTGSLSHPPYMGANITSKCVKVDSVPTPEIPEYRIPPLKPDEWYYENGYVTGVPLANNIKIYSQGNYIDTRQVNAENVIIVCKEGDVSISGWNRVITGVIVAPKGKVTFSGSRFEGVVIARDGFDVPVYSATIVSSNIENFIIRMEDFPFVIEDIEE